MAANPVPQQHREGQINDPPSHIPALPHVVWRCIINHLADRLDTLLNISALSADLQEICRPYTSSFFKIIMHPVEPLSRQYFYHDLVRLVLEGHLDASAVEEFCYTPVNPHYKPKVMPTDTVRPGLPSDATEKHVSDFRLLVRQAVSTSPSITSLDLESEVCTRFHQGDQDAALAVFLPLCTKLKMLEPPVRREICGKVFKRILQEYQQQGICAEDARSYAKQVAARDSERAMASRVIAGPCSNSLPFRQLLVLHVHADNLGCSYPLVEIAPFMCLPSLDRIILAGLIDQKFPGWPSGMKCSCPEIYFECAAVSRQAVLAFAEGLDPTPFCTIREWYKRPRGDVIDSNEGDPDWDHVSIERRASGGNTVEIRLVDEGGIPGYDYAWVSWIYWGKMRDWRRLDEEFELEEKDVDVWELWH